MTNRSQGENTSKIINADEVEQEYQSRVEILQAPKNQNTDKTNKLKRLLLPNLKKGNKAIKEDKNTVNSFEIKKDIEVISQQASEKQKELQDKLQELQVVQQVHKQNCFLLPNFVAEKDLNMQRRKEDEAIKLTILKFKKKRKLLISKKKLDTV